MISLVGGGVGGWQHILMISFLCVSRRASHDAPKSPRALLNCVDCGCTIVDVCMHIYRYGPVQLEQPDLQEPAQQSKVLSLHQPFYNRGRRGV